MSNDIEPDDDAPDTSEDDVSNVRVSFFAGSRILDAGITDYAAWEEIEDADEAVCAAVWGIFAKDSTARGFDARSARSIRASVALAARHAAEGVVRRAAADDDEDDSEDEEMDQADAPEPAQEISEPVKAAPQKYVRGEDGLTERERSILHAHEEIAREKGPGRASHREIAVRAGVAGANEGSRIGTVTNVLRSLRARGLCGPVARRGPKDTFEAPPGFEREVTEMAKRDDGLTTRARVILAAWKALYAERNGPHFSNSDVAERAAIVGKSPHSRANNVHGVVRELRLRGLLVPPTKDDGIEMKTEPEVDMAREKGDDGLTDKQRAVLVAWTALKREKGDDFNNEDVAKRAGIKSGTASARSANVSNVLKRLRASGMVGAATPTPAKGARATPRSAPTQPKAQGPASRVVAPSAATDDPLLAALVARRAAAVERVARIDAAIAAVKDAS